MAATNIQSFSGDVEVSSNLTVDTNTLHVDSVAGRVGVGKTDPAYTVDVNGTLNATSLYLGGSEFTGGGGGFDETADPIAIGTNAGATAQTSKAIAVGYAAGQTSQGSQSIAIGEEAGNSAQSCNSVAIGGLRTGRYNQSSRSVALGSYAGESTQGERVVALGYRAGNTSQSKHSVALGYASGYTSQGSGAVAVGYYAGRNSQAGNTVAVGHDAGLNSQAYGGVSIGYAAGQSSQQNYAVAIGFGTAVNNQASYSVAVGTNSGYHNQSSRSVAVGAQAGYGNQSSYSVAVGNNAGHNGQSYHATAVGHYAGRSNQSNNATAVGRQAAETGQGALGLALGYAAAQYNQGIFAVAVGPAAGRSSQPSYSTFFSTYSVRDANGNEYVHYNNSTGEISRGNNYSDDRLKYNEKIITGAIKSLFKLRPEEYDKKPSLKPSHTGQNWKRESGLIAQEIFYNAPELRHIVQVPQTAGDVENYTPPPSDDPNQDPDYSVWGPDSPAVKYEQFVPYLIKAVQEIVTELPRSKTTVSNTWGQNITGLVVSANANAHKTNTTPIVALSNVYVDKAWYGVVSTEKTDTNDYDTLINTKGDTLIWVTDVGGSLECGDLVTTSNVAPGYAQKQGDDFIRSYTVAKVTQDCDFTEPTQRPIRIPKQELSNVTYYTRVTEQDITLDVYKNLYDTYRKIKTFPIYFRETEDGGTERYYHGETEVGILEYEDLPENERSKKRFVEIEPDEYEELDDEEKVYYTLGTRNRYFVLNFSKSKTPIPEHDEEVVVQEMVDVLDENGQIVWEETANTVPEYILVDHGSYKAALVSAKLI